MKKLFFAWLTFVAFSFPAMAQKKGIYRPALIPIASPGEVKNLNLPMITTLTKEVKRAKAEIRTDFGGDYQFGKPGSGADFNLKIDFTLSAYIGPGTPAPVFTKNYSFTIDNNHPEGYLSKDLADRIVTPGSLTQTGLDVDRLEISSISVTDLMVSPAVSYSQALSGVKVYLSYEIEYRLDARMKGSEITISQPVLASGAPKSAVFNWSTTYPYPDYQFQLLRLYNIDPLKNTSDQDIKAVIDWTKAVTIETESDLKQLKLTVAEGTGFYAWRVRPIGTYYEGTIANSSNWGDWNGGAPAQNLQVTLPLAGQPSYFFFLDPDDNKNYIYSRTFTEENKIKESISYANSLLQEKQSQVYIPSDNTTITTQTVQDYVGRPALKTMPVPVPGELQGYKDDFAKTGGELYSEKHFDPNDPMDPDDIAGKINNPALIDNTSKAGSYYTGTGNVPSAQGYSYNRVIFYNDGSGRVKEQSGVGKEHMVGDQAQGRGRTVKTLYSTPSQDELLAFFGSEAPNHESVQKIITIDQNNIASITYQGKDGKVIATALSFLDNTSTSLLPLDNVTGPINVTDKIVGGVKTGDAYVSSKRIVLTQATSFLPEYMIECKKFEQLCADIKLDCGYEVKVIIHNVDHPENDIILSKVVKDLECNDVTICGVTTKYMTVASGDWIVSGTSSLPVTLQPGTYMIEKKLVSSKDVKVIQEHQQEKINAQIDPIKDWMISSLKAVECPDQLTVFYNNLITLGNLFKNNTLAQSNTFACAGCNGSISFPDDFWTLYTNVSLHSQFSVRVFGIHGEITEVPFKDSPMYVVISTPCCAGIKVDVTYSPPFKCPPPASILNTPNNLDRDTAGNPSKLEVNYDFLTHPEKTEYFPDFEGYAISMLKNCNGRETQDAKDIFYSYIQGWKEGEFNQMVYHMLTDQYSCNGGGNNTPLPENNSDPGSIEVDVCTPASESMVPGTQYRCAELSKCWSNLVMVLTESYCVDPGDLLDSLQGGGNVSNGVDEQNQGDKGPHDGFFDNANLSGIVKFLAKALLSKKMRKMQDPNDPEGLPADQLPNVVFHLADLFLHCTGYKFADILEPLPCSSGSIGVIGPFKVPGDFNAAVPENSNYNSCTYKQATPAWEETVVELDANFNPVPNGKKIKNLFPNIYNPIYAFKYFEYQPERFPLLEAMTCYRDPNECWVVQGGERVTVPCCTDPADPSFCIKEYGHPRADLTDAGGNYKLLVKDFCSMGKIICPYTKVDWSCSQREFFFQLLKAYREPATPWEEEPITCSWMTEVKKWYEVPVAFKDSTSLKYIDREQYKKFTDKYPEEESPAVNSKLLDGLKPTADGTKTDYLATMPKEEITYVEYLATKTKTDCLAKCDARRTEVRASVLQMFLDRCYVFDGCKLTDQDNIVYMEDIDKIVDAIVAESKKQCLLTTYTCATTNCRQLSTHYDVLGHNDSYSDLQLGAGGKPSTPADCPAGIGSMTPCCTNINSSSKVTTDGIPCNSSYTLTFYEYTNTKQAEGWHLELDIESKCNSSGVYVDADNDGIRDPYTLYYYKMVNNQRVLVVQNPLTCEPRLPATTYVPRDAYEVKTNVPLDVNIPQEKVESDKIKVVIQGN